MLERLVLGSLLPVMMCFAREQGLIRNMEKPECYHHDHHNRRKPAANPGICKRRALLDRNTDLYSGDFLQLKVPRNV